MVTGARAGAGGDEGDDEAGRGVSARPGGRPELADEPLGIEDPTVPGEDDLDDDMILGAGEVPEAGSAGRPVPSHVPRDALDDDAATARTHRSPLRRAWVRTRQWARRGARRARSSAAAVVLSTVTCVVTFLISRELLDQPYPVVGPILVWVALGIQRDRPPRRVAELGLGSTLGVVLGELSVALLGQGPLQFGIMIIAAALIGRFLDSAELFANQVVIQVMFLTTMPAAMVHGGPMGRWAEAAVGCVLAILASTFLRRDPGRRPRQLGAAALSDLASVLEETARALRTGDPGRAADALTTARDTQSGLDEWASAARTAREIALVNPALRGRKRELDTEVDTATMTDRAVRNARVVARLAIGAIDEEGANPVVGGHLQRLAVGTRLLSHAHRLGMNPSGAREVLESVSRELSPVHHRLPGWRSQMVESLLRSLAVDLLQVSGASHTEATRVLPR